MKYEEVIHWKETFGDTQIAFTCQDRGEVYLSFDWNGALVWEYACTAGPRHGKDLAAWLRRVADKIEATADFQADSIADSADASQETKDA